MEMDSVDSKKNSVVKYYLKWGMEPRASVIQAMHALIPHLLKHSDCIPKLTAQRRLQVLHNTLTF